MRPILLDVVLRFGAALALGCALANLFYGVSVADPILFGPWCCSSPSWRSWQAPARPGRRHGCRSARRFRSNGARRLPKVPDIYSWEEVVEFSPIPCWAHLPPEVYRARVKTLVDTVVAEAALERSRTGRPVEGVESILARDPQHRPTKLARSPAPLVHAATDKGREESLLRDVLLVRGRLPLRGGEVEAGRSRGAFPSRQLPSGPALRRGIAGPRSDL
jgi:hypothetical protein